MQSQARYHPGGMPTMRKRCSSAAATAAAGAKSARRNKSSSSRRRRNDNNRAIQYCSSGCLLIVALAALFDRVQFVASFAAGGPLRTSSPLQQRMNNPCITRSTVPVVALLLGLGSTFDPEDEVNRRLLKAREVLAKSKAKLQDKERNNGLKNSDDSSSKKEDTDVTAAAEVAHVPFFAVKKRIDPNRREQVIKARNSETGLVQADGEKMAAMSETEEWEFRSLFEVFENEMTEDEDVNSAASQQLAERDVAASIWNLRKSMRTEDYMKIFDKKNYFIGDLD